MKVILGKHLCVFMVDYVVKSMERRFAEDLDNAEGVCVYAKLPRRFHITPILLSLLATNLPAGRLRFMKAWSNISSL